jgi:NADH:ubiquinone oxidoreductase subunit F (NADH-binding)
VSAPEGLPRLLRGLDEGSAVVGLEDHRELYGPLPKLAPEQLIAAVEASGLRGRGGADFPTGVKLRAVARRRGVAAVIVNGSETEPASAKDALLLGRLPHLVLDGALLAAHAVGAPRVIVRMSEARRAAAATMAREAPRRRTRHIDVQSAAGPSGYVVGEETAVVAALEGGPAKPTFTPPRPYERGLLGRPTLIQNAETLAQLALIARYGPEWFRSLGTAEDPGTVLLTLSGAVSTPGVYEVALGAPISELIGAAGGATEPLQAVLVGGYFGTWVAAREVMALPLARSSLAQAGASLGSGVLIALGRSACGLHESARLAAYLAAESAGQCGPCVHGLRAIADGLGRLARGTANRQEADRVLRWCSEVRGRGACHHPNGAARLVESSLRVFADDIERHRAGGCDRAPAGLPLGRAASRRAAAADRGRTRL